MKSSRNVRQRRFASITSLCLATVWCLLLINCETVVPRQGWSENWGPMVPHETFPGDCQICHLTNRWDVLRENFAFDHARQTGYALEGAHAHAACLRCHNDLGSLHVYLARGCGGCHSDPHGANLGMNCTRCHSQSDWSPTGLVAEHARTRFPLIGAHAIVPCETCHERATVGEFRGAPVDCHLCHQRDVAQVTSPDHMANGWNRDCERCHTGGSWGGAQIVHDFFPLLGGHSGVECAECHANANFSGASSDCFSCHAAEYQNAPNHVASNFSQDCTECHSVNGWDGANIVHDFFPLVGGHAGLDCAQCHAGGNFAAASPACFSCHAADYQTAPGHLAGSFSQDCTVCHDVNGWEGANFQHDIFPLNGGHGGLECTQCHNGGTFVALPTDCFSCHQADFQGAPNHAAKGYPTDCAVCHDTNAWDNSTFNHTFPLQGDHNATCDTCHTGGNTASFTCFACHEHRKSEADNEHKEVNGYTYDSQACFGCHPNGRD